MSIKLKESENSLMQAVFIKEEISGKIIKARMQKNSGSLYTFAAWHV